MFNGTNFVVKDRYGCQVHPGDIVAYAKGTWNQCVTMHFYAIKEITDKGSIMAYRFDERFPSFLINKKKAYRLASSRMLHVGTMQKPK